MHVATPPWLTQTEAAAALKATRVISQQSVVTCCQSKPRAVDSCDSCTQTSFLQHILLPREHNRASLFLCKYFVNGVYSKGWSRWKETDQSGFPPDSENSQKPKDPLNFEEENMQLLEASTPQDRKTYILFYSLAFWPSPSWFSWSRNWPYVADSLIWSGRLSDDTRWERLVNHNIATP